MNVGGIVTPGGSATAAQRASRIEPGSKSRPVPHHELLSSLSTVAKVAITGAQHISGTMMALGLNRTCRHRAQLPARPVARSSVADNRDTQLITPRGAVTCTDNLISFLCLQVVQVFLLPIRTYAHLGISCSTYASRYLISVYVCVRACVHDANVLYTVCISYRESPPSYVHVREFFVVSGGGGCC